MALIDKLKAIGDAIRAKTGGTETLTLDQMVTEIEAIEGTGEEAVNYILVDENGNEFAATLVDEEVSLTATANDLRLGTSALTEEGYTEGEKVIPAYHTYQGARLIPNGSTLLIPNLDTTVDSYDYTKLQTIICLFNTTISDSVSTEQVVIDENLYDVKSTEIVSVITKDHETKNINFGITNNTGSSLVIRYFMYKEII